ncbi:hypothetical protein [Prosthecobacter dejongeii]|uniref:Uncharacterized protein n=1 Tax=Prosthecobacter dejongeii TaxID=48465 RepID=A0A7W7YMA7_9BACT|nr:hypothetical protein [Prosthecobacter dejongeii]MBB5038647.1 hypothetical protein [Prosthecobacter dejongeii]
MSDSPRPKRTRSAPLQTTGPEGEAWALKTQLELEQLISGEGPVDLAELKTVVGKMQVVIADYLESGKNLNITLQPIEILSAIDAALEEAQGRPSPWPDGADARTFFVHGLYDEIIQQPSNIFETRLFPDGSQRYIPISPALWKACLHRLRESITHAKLR